MHKTITNRRNLQRPGETEGTIFLSIVVSSSEYFCESCFQTLEGSKAQKLQNRRPFLALVTSVLFPRLCGDVLFSGHLWYLSDRSAHHFENVFQEPHGAEERSL